MSKRVFLVRHGEPVVAAGQKGKLSPRGIHQTKELAARLKDSVGLATTIFHSSSLRCLETATIIGDVLDLTINQEDLRLSGSEKLVLRDSGKLDIFLEVQARLGIESADGFRNRIRHLINSTPGDIIMVGNELPIALLMRYDTKGVIRKTITHASCTVSELTDNGENVWKQLV